MNSHAAVAAVLLEREGTAGADAEQFVAEVLEDLESSRLGEKEKVLLRFIDKVNHDSPRISADDMKPLLDAGWTEEGIYYAITVCALFNFYNRWIDATGVHPLSEQAHRQGGRRSADAGYIRK